MIERLKEELSQMKSLNSDEISAMKMKVQEKDSKLHDKELKLEKSNSKLSDLESKITQLKEGDKIFRHACFNFF